MGCPNTLNSTKKKEELRGLINSYYDICRSNAASYAEDKYEKNPIKNFVKAFSNFFNPESEDAQTAFRTHLEKGFDVEGLKIRIHSYNEIINGALTETENQLANLPMNRIPGWLVKDITPLETFFDSKTLPSIPPLNLPEGDFTDSEEYTKAINESLESNRQQMLSALA